MNAIDAIKDREVLEGHLASLLEVESLLSPEEATMACYWQAYFNLVDGDYEAAIRGFTKVINSNPPRDPAYNIEAYTCRAYAFSGHGDFDSALESWTTMIRLSPRNLQFYIQRGYTWHKKGKYTQAIEDYSEAIKISPEDPVAYSVRGDAWRLSGKLDEALQDYNSAIQWGPNEGSLRSQKTARKSTGRFFQSKKSRFKGTRGSCAGSVSGFGIQETLRSKALIVSLLSRAHEPRHLNSLSFARETCGPSVYESARVDVAKPNNIYEPQISATSLAAQTTSLANRLQVAAEPE